MRPGPIWRAQSNLPAPLTSFVGRTREVAALTARLAEQALERTIREVWLVELATISDPGYVPGAVAVVLGVRDTPERPLVEALTERIGERSLLLVLDNCEHLVNAVADLVLSLLRGCPGLRVLATSQAPLGLSGEADWRVPPLTSPDITRLPARLALARFPAIQLFVERARDARADFALTEANALDVVRVCARLDGLPLAIELAASRIVTFTPGEIAARLDDRFAFLTHGRRAALPHQRTLRESVDWSHDLLSEPERILLRRLSVFRGGWTLEAAERVASTELRVASYEPDHSQLATHDPLLDVLASLVEKSLVQTDVRDGTTRHTMLETIREYAADRLREASEGETLVRQHWTWCVDLAERAATHLRRPDQAGWRARLEVEHDNVRAALDRTIEYGEAEPGLRLCIALWHFWIDRGHAGEGYAWLRQLLAFESASGRTVLRAAGLFVAAKLAFDGADLATALALGDESLAIAREVGDPHTLHRTLTHLGHIALGQGDWLAARRFYEEGLPIRRELGEPVDVAVSLACLGHVARALHEYGAAQALYEESLTLAIKQDHPAEITAAQHDLGRLAHERGDDDEAATWYAEALPVAHQIKHPRRTAYVLEGFAALAARGRPERALQLAGAAATLRRASGSILSPSDQAALERELAPARRILGSGRSTAALASGLALTTEQAVEFTLQDGPVLVAPRMELSGRAMEVASLVSRGMTNRQIADELVIHERTVANHLQRIFGKLGLNGRVQLAAWALEHGLGGDPPA